MNLKGKWVATVESRFGWIRTGPATGYDGFTILEEIPNRKLFTPHSRREPPSLPCRVALPQFPPYPAWRQVNGRI